MVRGTLLGPEGTGWLLFSFVLGWFSVREGWWWVCCLGRGPTLRSYRAFFWCRVLVSCGGGLGVGAGCRGWGRWLFENCTVDASIFCICGKFVRAYGGCLGTRSR